MTPSADQAGELLRARGMRSTPQRRAILGAFGGGRAEHLSADEVYALATRSLPDLSRGTVYATLAEFTEAGLLAAFGAPEPVRYETNTAPHSHFRCRLCLRIFDIELGLRDSDALLKERGFVIERIDIRAEGICEECREYESGLRAGARTIARSGAAIEAIADRNLTVAETDSPLGPLLLAATADGIVRVAFGEHADADALRSRGARGSGRSRAATHLKEAARQLAGYFDGRLDTLSSEIDWSAFDSNTMAALRATLEIPFGQHRSYSTLGLDQPARRLGQTFGSNPIPLLAPCHRVSRGLEVPSIYVAGSERRRWLEAHERAYSPLPLAE